MNADRDRSIRGEGAERYVQAVLMLRGGLIVSQASPYMPDYDLLASDQDGRSLCRIQVKYRAAETSRPLKLKNRDFDILAYVLGNASRDAKRRRKAVTPQPVTFIIPCREIEKFFDIEDEHETSQSTMFDARGERRSDRHPNPAGGSFERYREAWYEIDDWLDIRRWPTDDWPERPAGARKNSKPSTASPRSAAYK